MTSTTASEWPTWSWFAPSITPSEALEQPRSLYWTHVATSITPSEALEQPRSLYFTREEQGILRDFFKAHPTVYRVSRNAADNWIVEMRKTYPGETVATSFFGKSFWIETAYAKAVASQVAHELAQ